MRNKKWMAGGAHWRSAEDRRANRRFLRHVRSVSNPKGRIHREACFRKDCDCPAGQAEAHHPDYTRPFLVLWVCVSDHRRVEQGTLKYRKTDLWNYESLVNQRPGAQKPLPAKGEYGHLRVVGAEDAVPF